MTISTPPRRQHRLRRVLSWAVALLCLGPIPSAIAVDLLATFWEIDADTLTYVKEPPSITASGSVVLRQHDTTTDDTTAAVIIHADTVHYDMRAETVRATGDLRIDTPEDRITATDAFLDLRHQTGSFTRSTLFHRENNLYLSGATMEKSGALTYRLTEGMVTTCPLDEGIAPPWSFHSTDTRITREGYAILRHASFRIKNHPIIYTPLLLLPAKTSRQTGLLFPEYSQSNRDGTGLVTPFFINLSPNSDITLYPGLLSRRGVLAGGEFRYVLDPRSRGTVAINYLHDTKDETTDNEFNSDAIMRTNTDRYWLRAKADHDFGNALVARLDLDIVSDRDYLQEFQKGITGFDAANTAFLADYRRGFQAKTINQRENCLQLAKAWPTMYLQGQMLAINDVRDEAVDVSPLWTLPRLTFSGYRPLPRLPFDLSWDSEYAYFRRDHGRDGHRLNLHPRLLTALPFGPFIEAAAAAGLQQTLYRTTDETNAMDQGNDTNGSRTLMDVDTTLATTLARNFGQGLDASTSGRSLRHLIRPEIGYSFVTERDQDDLPLFDNIDRIDSRSWLHYGVRNQLTLRSSNKDHVEAVSGAILDLSQIYDTEADDHPWSDLLVEIDFRPTPSLRLAYETAISVYGMGVPYYDVMLRYADQRGNKARIDYRYKRSEAVQEPYFYSTTPGESLQTIHARLATAISEQLAIQGDITHSLAANRVIESSLRISYQPGCWALGLVGSYTPEETSLALVLSLTGIGKALEVGLPGI